MRRETSLHPTQPPTGTPHAPPSNSANDSVLLDAPTDTLSATAKTAENPLFPGDCSFSSPAQSADHASSSISLAKTETTMAMVGSGNTSACAKSAARTASTPERDVVSTHIGSERPLSPNFEGDVDDSEEDCMESVHRSAAAAAESASLNGDADQLGTLLAQRHPRCLRSLPYPSPVAAMSGQLIRETAAAATAAATTTLITATLEAEQQQQQQQQSPEPGAVGSTAEDSWTSQPAKGEVAIVPRAALPAVVVELPQPSQQPSPPLPAQSLVSLMAATGPPSYMSARTTTPSTATIRTDDQNTSRDAVLLPDPSSPPPWTLEPHEGVNVSAVAPNDGEVVRMSAVAGHSATSSSAFQRSATRRREFVVSVDKSVESNALNSIAATSAPSRAKSTSVSHTGALSTHVVPYRVRSHRFSTSVGRNADSHVYLNTNVMSYYEMAPKASAAGVAAAPDASTASASSEAPPRSAATSSARGRAMPISSLMATGAAEPDMRVTASHSRSPSAGAAALTEATQAATQSTQQQQCPYFATADVGSGNAACIPMSGRYTVGDSRVQWSRPEMNHTQVVRVVNGLLRSPLLDELGGTQFSESSLQSPFSNAELAAGATMQCEAGGVGGGGVAGGRAGGAVVSGGVNAYRVNNPISALLAGGRPRRSSDTSKQQQQQSSPLMFGTSNKNNSNNTLANATAHGYSMSYDTGSAAGNDRASQRPSPQGYWRGGGGTTAYKAFAVRRGRSGGDSTNVNFPESGLDGGGGEVGGVPNSTGVSAGSTFVPSPPTSMRVQRLSTANTSASLIAQQQQQQQPSLLSTRRSISAALGVGSGPDAQLSSSHGVDSGARRVLPASYPSAPSSALKQDGSGADEEPQDVAAAQQQRQQQRQPSQRVLSSLRDVFAAVSFRSIPNLYAGTSTTSPSAAAAAAAAAAVPPSAPHPRAPSATAAGSALASSSTPPPPSPPSPSPPSPSPPPLPPTFALFGALERLSRFSELVQLRHEHAAVIDDFLSRLTLELHRTTHASTSNASNLGNGSGNGNGGDGGGMPAATDELHEDREFMRWHRILMFLFHNPTELMKVGVEFFSDALNSWPLHMLYLTCCFHVTACEHGFAALTAALQTGGIVCSGKGLFAALAVAMADGEEGLVRSTACMYRAAFYTGVLMRKRHQLFESETRLTTSGGFTLLVVNIPIMTLRRLVSRVNEGYDVFAPMNGNSGPGGGVADAATSTSSSTAAGRRGAVGRYGASPGSSPTSPSAQTAPFQPYSVIEVSRVISSRSAVLCGHPLDLLRLDMILARFADFNGVKIHKEYLPAGGPENSNFFNKRMPHELLGLWRARGVSFSLSSVRLPVYSPVNGDLWTDPASAFNRSGIDVNAVSSSLAVPPPGSYHDELFMYLVAEAATAANQDLTFSLRHMRDGNVLLDFSTHAIGIGRLIAWTNKSITVLAAPENRHESSAMPPPRRSPKDAAVLNTMAKLAIVNTVLREVGENLEQPPDALAHPRVDLFTTFTELGLLEVMRGAAEVGGASGTGGSDGELLLDGLGSHGRPLASVSGSSGALLAPARSFSDNQSGGSGGGTIGVRGGGIAGSDLVIAAAPASRADVPGSLFHSLPVPAAGRRMKSNVAALVSNRSFVANPGSTANMANTSLSTVTNNNNNPNTGNGNGNNASLSTLGAAGTTATNVATAGMLSIISFDAASGTGGMSSVGFNPPLPPPLPSSPSASTAAAATTTTGQDRANAAAGLPLTNQEEGPSGSNGGSASAMQQDCPPGVGGDSATPSMDSYPECHWPSALNVFAMAGGGPSPGSAAAAASTSSGLLVPSPTSVLIHREHRRSNTGGSNSGGLAATTTNTMTHAKGALVNQISASQPDVTEKTSLRESDVDNKTGSLLLRPPSAHRPASLLSNSPSQHIAWFAPESDTVPSPPPPPCVRSRTHESGEDQCRGQPSPQQQQQQQQSNSKGGTPTSPSSLWQERPPSSSSQRQQPQPPQFHRASSTVSANVSDHHLVSLPSARGSSNNNTTTTTTRSLRGIQYVQDAEEPETSVSGGSGSRGGVNGLTSPLLQRGVLNQLELPLLSAFERDYVICHNNDYAGIVNVYQVSPLIMYYEMQFNCVLCDGAVLFACLLRKASGIPFPPYTLLLCPSVFSLLELWDGFEFEDLWRRSVGAVSTSHIASPTSAGLL